MNGALYISESRNGKLAHLHEKIDATYASIEGTCSSTCPLKGEACYAELGNAGIHVARLNKESMNLSPIQIARAEAKAIRNAYSGESIPENRNLRLHVSGDSRTIKGTRILAKAIENWKARGGNIAYTYTHSWKNIKRKEWGSISVLASIEKVSQVKEARKQGYAPAIVVEEFSSDKSFSIAGTKTKFIPCPAQTRDRSCISCRLCFDGDALFKRNMGIAFAAHGSRKEKMKRKLKVI